MTRMGRMSLFFRFKRIDALFCVGYCFILFVSPQISHVSLGFLIIDMFLIVLLFISYAFAIDFNSENEAKEFIDKLNNETSVVYSEAVAAEWNYVTNISEYNKNLMVKTRLKLFEFQKENWKIVTRFQYKNFNDSLLRRQFEKYSVLGEAALDKDAHKFTEIVTEMEEIYATAKITVDNNDISLEPGIVDIFKTERDFDKLKEVWVKWREATGSKMRKYYETYVRFGNQIARKNSVGGLNFKDYGEYWLFAYDSLSIKEAIKKIWEEVQPFYKQLHAFVRMKLRKKYGDKMPKDGTIPAHLLGDVWAQSWVNILPEITPFPDIPRIDYQVTQTMRSLDFNQTSMFQMADDFFVSLGLEPLPDEFWKNSLLAKPDDREVICHPSAVDFRNGRDFRVKQCAEVNMEDLKVVHHEIGHIQYYMLYRTQPFVLRDGANPGFHEAIGDLVSISVSTPDHLLHTGLLHYYEDNIPSLLNYQLIMALDKVAFLPFGYLVDLWRWDVFSGKISRNEYNKKWWEFRVKYQGVSPPVIRNENEFDAGAKYHVAADSPFMRYFIAHILQFQIHKSLCNLSNQTVLHKCDLSANKAVGQKLRDVLSQGMSVPWPEQLLQLTNSEMSGKALLEYFEPLRVYLEHQLKDEQIGWETKVDDYFSSSLHSSSSVAQISMFMASIAVFNLIITFKRTVTRKTKYRI